MSTIRESLYITYNEQTSQSYGIVSCNIGGGSLLEEPIVGSRTLNKTRVRNRDISYFHDITSDPLTFTLNLAFESDSEWDEDIFRSVKRWLLEPTNFSQLVFSAMPDKIYYCLVVGQPRLFHTTTHRGYISVDFECNASSAFSAFQSPNFDLSVNPTSTTVIIANNGDTPVYPTIEFKKIGTGNISFQNLSDGGNTLTFSDIPDGETINIDLETDIVESSLDELRTDNWNSVLLRLLRGNNSIRITGTAQISFIFQYRLN